MIRAMLIAEEQDAPWELGESMWKGFSPVCVPAGVWLDVGRQKPYRQLPLWMFTIDLVEPLTQLTPGLTLPREELTVCTTSSCARR
jgi:hypothetical protein